MKHFRKKALAYLVIMAMSLSILPAYSMPVFADEENHVSDEAGVETVREAVSEEKAEEVNEEAAAGKAGTEEAAGEGEGLEASFTNSEYTADSVDVTVGTALTAMGLVVSYNGVTLEKEKYTVTYTVGGEDVTEEYFDLPIGQFNPYWGSLSIHVNVYYGETEIYQDVEGEIKIKCMTINYDGNGATGSMASDKVPVGAILESAYNNGFSKDGYVFVGWSTTKDGDLVYFEDSSIKADSERTLTLYAIWRKAGKYTLRLNGNGTLDSFGDEYRDYTFEVEDIGESLYSWEEREDGYYFAGWAKSSSATAPDYVLHENGDYYYSDWWQRNNGDFVELYAVYVRSGAKKYTISFNANGGDGTMSNQSADMWKYTNLKKNEFTFTDHYFRGWSKNPEAEDPDYSDGKWIVCPAKKPGDTVTLYAVWGEAGTYTVSFNANGGTGTMEPQIIKLGERVQLSANKFTYEDHYFKGWANYSDDSYPYYTDKQEVLNIAKSGDSVTLFAVWGEEGNYTVSFNANGGTGTMADQILTLGDTTQKLNKNTFTRDGYTFRGWDTDKDSSYARFRDEETVYYDLAGKNETVTLYAIWGGTDDTKVTVKFNSNGGKGTMSDLIYDAGKSQKLTKNTFTRDGYVFGGWMTNPDGYSCNYRDEEQIGTYFSGGTILNLYAYWEKLESYTVSFNANGGTGIMESQVFRIGEKKSLTKNAFKNRAGYVFKGWAYYVGGPVEFTDGQEVEDLGCDGQIVDLYAVWEDVGTYTVSFNANGGTGTMADQVFTVSQAQALAKNTFTRDGYTFIGWSDAAGGTVKYKDGQSVELGLAKGGSATLYAIWDKNGSYTVSFNANGGTGTMASQTLSRNIAGKLSKNAFTREGYTFMGWSLSSNGTVNYTDEQSVTNLASIGQTLVLYAIWKENSVTPPADSKTYAIHVSTGAKAEKGGQEVYSAKTGEVITITYAAPSSDVKFSQWLVTGAAVADSKNPVTTFTMGSSDVDVSFKTTVDESSRYEELPEGADTTTKVSKLAFKKKTLKLDVNSEEENSATPVVTSGEAPAVCYYTENSDIVAVTQTGKFIGRGQGTAKVYAQCGTKKATCTVTVTSHTTDIAILDPDNNDIAGKDLTIKSGGMVQLRVDFKPVDTTDPKAVKWIISSKKVATVNNGLITAKEFTDKDGSAVITVAVDRIGSDGKKVRLEKKINLTVKAVNVAKNVSKDNTHTLNLSGSMKMVTASDKNTGTLKVTLKPKKKGADVSNIEISVESTDPEIVDAKIGEYTVYKKNRINRVSLTAKKCGTAYIIVRSGDLEDSSKCNVKRCKVTVTSPAEKAEITADSLGLLKKSGDKKTITLRKGMSDTLTAVVTPEYSTDIKGAKWSVKGAGVRVKNGVITAKKVTKANKPAKITFKCGSVSETIEVTVTK